MTERNPYAAPAPTPEELPEPSRSVPMTFREASWQRIRTALRWGTWIWLVYIIVMTTICLWIFLTHASTREAVIENLKEDPWMTGLVFTWCLLGSYMYLCFWSPLIGLVALSVDRLVKRIVAALHRHRKPGK